MTTLVRLELRRQVPFIAFLLLFGAFGYGLDLLSALPHELTLGHSLLKFPRTEGSGVAFVSTALGLALALSLFAREFDDGTVEWLDALPTTRGRRFVAKIATGMLIVAIYPTFELLLFFATEWLGTDSLNPTLRSTGLWINWAATLALFWVTFAYAVILCYLRILAWIVALLLLGALEVVASVAPELAYLNPSMLLGRLEVHGARFHIDPKVIVVHGIAALLCFSLAWWVFLHSGSREVRAARPFFTKGARLGSLARGLAWAAVVIPVMACVVVWFERGWGRDPAERTPLSWSTARERSGSLLASYSTSQRGRAADLLQASPEVLRQVEEFFGTKIDFDIRLDMTSSRRHTAGTTLWKQVNIDLASSADPRVLRAVLGHELAHVCMNVLTDGKLSDRMFHEGVASYVEKTLFMPEGIDDGWLLAATSAHWNGIGFDELVNAEELSRKWDADVVYPMGETFFRTVVDEHGAALVPRLLKVVTADVELRALAGMAFWRQLFRRVDLGLAPSIARWRAELQARIQRGAVVARAAPSGKAQWDHDYFYVVHGVESPDGWRLVARARAHAGASQLQYVPMQLGDDAKFFWASRERLASGGGACQYQLGFASDKGQVWGPWIDAQE